MLTKKELTERLTTIRDIMDTDFMNRYTIEGVVKDINNLLSDIDKEIGEVHTTIEVN
jgi:hypothetical protein